MMDDIEVLDSNYEVVTINGDLVVVQKQLDDFSNASQDSIIDGGGYQILTLGEPDEGGWAIEETEDLPEKTPARILVGPPAVVEENSSDSNYPAIGHLNEFSFSTAEDGTLLPANVTATMADGSHQRLILFPQIIDGNVTYMVQFVDDELAAEEPVIVEPEEPTLSQKIDSIISKNEDIIANSKKMRTTTKKGNTNNGITKAQRFRQKSLIRNNKSLLKVNLPQSDESHLPDALFKGHKDLKEKTKYMNTPSLNANSKIPSELQLNKNLLNFQKYLESQKLQLKIQPIEPKESGRPIKPKLPLEQPFLNVAKAKLSNVSPVAPLSPSPTEDVDNDGIFIKTSPEYFTNKEKNDHPLGSTENPIQLLQTGKTFHSRQPLSETQLQQISSILRKQKRISSEMPKSMYDPNTNTRIVYRVVFPEDVDKDLDKDEQGKEVATIKRQVKRSRQKGKHHATEGDFVTNEHQKKSNKEGSEHTGSELQEECNSPPSKIAKVARTRSGRLSRPPRHMVRDYKRIQNVANVSNRANEEEWYLDYRTTEDEPTNKSSLFSSGLRPRAKIKQRNVRPEYRCPTCHKIYLGHSRMMWHLRKFPDHSNADEYDEIYQRARSERKARSINVFKLKQMISGVDRDTLQAAYGPFLADAFTIWDFLLLRVRLLKKSGVEEVEGLFKELTQLLEKLGKMSMELLSPAYSRDDEDAHYIEVDKLEIACVLGLPIGTYKVNSNRLNLLHLAEEDQRPPAPPAPRPTTLSTKFEPNLSTKLLECSNDSIDLDCSSKDVEPEEEKKEDTNSKFLSEFLQSLPEQTTDNHIPSSTNDGLSLWKSRENVAHVTPPPMWNKTSSPHSLPTTAEEELSLWKGGKTVDASEDLQIWKQDEVRSWKNGDTHGRNSGSNMWKECGDQAWKNTSGDSGRECIWEGDGNGLLHSQSEASSAHVTKDEKLWACKASSSSVDLQNGVSSDLWLKDTSIKAEEWVDPAAGKDGKKDWMMRLWKEEAGAPGLRTSRLTSTPESHGPTLFSPPLRRNSVSSFAPSHQEELLTLDFHELFEDLLPDQNKPRRPKPNSIESIINEALFTGNEPPPTHSSLPPSLNIITDSLDEVTNLDFLNQD